MPYTLYTLTWLLCIFLPFSLTSHHLIGIFLPVLGLFACIEYYGRHKKLPQFDGIMATFLLCLLVWGATTYFWAEEAHIVISRIVKASLLFLGGWLLYSTASSDCEKQKHYIFKWLTPALGLTAGFFLFEVYCHYPFSRFIAYIQGEKWVYFPPSTNWTPVIMTVLLWPILEYLSDKQSLPVKYQYISISLVALVTMATFSSACQSAVLALIVGSCVYVAAKYIKHMPLILFAILAIGLILSPLLSQWLYHFRPDILTNWSSAAAPQRMEIWDGLAKKIMQKPYFGWGIESTKSMTLDIKHTFFQPSSVLHPHNVALQLWIEMGILGVIFGLIFLAICLKRIQNYTSCAYRLAGFSAIVSIALTGYGMWQGWWLALIFTSITLFCLNRPFICETLEKVKS